MQTSNAIDLSAYIADLTRDFTAGREWLFAEIDRWLAAPDAPRYFIITGELDVGRCQLQVEGVNYAIR